MNERKELCCMRRWTSGSRPGRRDRAVAFGPKKRSTSHHENYRDLLNRTLELPTRGGWLSSAH